MGNRSLAATGSRLTSQDMPFQVLISGKGLATIGTEHHLGRRKSVCTVWTIGGLKMVETALGTVADNVQEKPMGNVAAPIL